MPLESGQLSAVIPQTHGLTITDITFQIAVIKMAIFYMTI